MSQSWWRVLFLISFFFQLIILLLIWGVDHLVHLWILCRRSKLVCFLFCQSNFDPNCVLTLSAICNLVHLLVSFCCPIHRGPSSQAWLARRVVRAPSPFIIVRAPLVFATMAAAVSSASKLCQTAPSSATIETCFASCRPEPIRRPTRSVVVFNQSVTWRNLINIWYVSSDNVQIVQSLKVTLRNHTIWTLSEENS